MQGMCPVCVSRCECHVSELLDSGYSFVTDERGQMTALTQDEGVYVSVALKRATNSGLCYLTGFVEEGNITVLTCINLKLLIAESSVDAPQESA